MQMVGANTDIGLKRLSFTISDIYLNEAHLFEMFCNKPMKLIFLTDNVFEASFSARDYAT